MSGIQDRVSERLTKDRLALELRRARRPFAQWLLLLLGALIAFVLLLHELHQPAPWSSQYTFGVEVASADAAAPNDQVRIAGVQVGKVTAVNLRGGAPVIEASIDPKYGPLFRNARIDLRPNTPLQDMYLDIVSRGTRAAGPIPTGGRVSVDQTDSPVQIGQVIDLFDSAVRPRVTAAINALGQGLGDHGAQLREALVELAPFLQSARDLNEQLAVRAGETKTLVHNFALLSTALAGRGAQLHGLVESGDTALQALSAQARPLGELLDQLPPTLAELPRSFAALRAASVQLDPAATALLPAARALGPALSALQRFSPTADAALGALARTLTPLRHLLSSSGPVALRLGSAFAALRPAVPQLYADTTTLLPCELAVEKFFQWTLSVSKLSSYQGDMQRGLGLISPQSVTDVIPGAQGPTVLKKAPTCTGTPS
ncbi:MAG TPA: MlaD family protein [Solirubrobacteraceae bacterium]|nr:MlaD family protein [Solirubrobacteraceae bacterium]